MDEPTPYRLVMTLDTRRLVVPLEQFIKAVLKLANRTFGIKVMAMTIDPVMKPTGSEKCTS